MPRPSTVLVIFVISMNLFAGAFLSMGVAEDLGLEDQVAQDEDVPTERAEDLPTGSGVGATLFGMYNILTQQAKNVFEAIYPALDMMNRAGVPGELTAIMGGLFSFVIFFDALSFIRGWGL